MTNDSSKKQRRARFLSWAVVCLSALLALSWFLWRTNQPQESAQSPAGANPAISAAQDHSSVWREADIAPPSKLPSYMDSLELTPGEVIDQPGCLSSGGSGAASDLAVVLVPGPEGSRFSVLKADGALVGGVLPFTPNHLRIARGADGSILTGFGDLR